MRSLYVALPALVALATLAALAYAQTPLASGVNITLTAGEIYTASQDVVVFFEKPVNITIVKSSVEIRIEGATNATLTAGASLVTSENVSAIVAPAPSYESKLSGAVVLASTCQDVSNARQSVKAVFKGPATVVVSAKTSDPTYPRYMIVTVDDDPATWDPIWYSNDKAFSDPPTKFFDRVIVNGVAEVEVPDGEHTVYAAVSTWQETWTICFTYLEANPPPPEQPVPVPPIGDNPSGPGNGNGPGTTMLIAVAAGGVVFFLILLFIAMSKRR